MQLGKIISATRHFVKANSDTILTTVGVSGVVTTAYLANQAGQRQVVLIEKDKDVLRDEEGDELYLDRRYYFDLLWRNYVPTVACGALTIACIVGAQKVGSRKIAATQAAFALTERAFSEYRDKVVEEYGEKKDQSIREEIAKEAMIANPPPSNLILSAEAGKVMCYEGFTGRYFLSDMETLRKAQNDINQKLLCHDYAYLDDFYYLIGLEGTNASKDFGWEVSKLMALEFSTVLSPEGKPCLSFSYLNMKVV